MNVLRKTVLWLISKLYRVRSGYYQISPTVSTSMEKKGISKADIDDVFRWGVEERIGKIKRKYADCTIGINYIKNDDGSYFITNCWKYQNYKDWLQPKVYKG